VVSAAASFCDAGEHGFGWVSREPPWMGRTSHALAADGRVWLVDPVDFDALDERVRALGEPAAVLQLVPWHNRDAAPIARRLDVPHLIVPERVQSAPFEAVRIPGPPRWRETALWWSDRRMLVVGETLGTVYYYRARGRRLGIHPFMRLRPPRFLERYEPQHILCGHGAGLHDGAADALRDALASARRDLLALPPRLLTARHHQFSDP
jgi:hypothetical protein